MKDEVAEAVISVATDEAVTVPPVLASTDKSLDKSLIKGIAWTGGVKWAMQALSWASMFIVAKLLTPADFGLIGLAGVYIGLLALINDFGLTAAVLKGTHLSDSQIAQIGGFGIVIGVLFTIVSAALAWPLALFWKDSAVLPVALMLSIDFTVVSIGVLPRALLARDLRFDRLAMIDGISNGTQMVLTLVLAVMGFRYYALVYSSLVGSAVGVGMALVWRRHRVAWPSPFHEIRDSVQVGWHLVVGRMAWYVYQNSDFFVVGRMLGKTLLGAYTWGWEAAAVPVEKVSAIVGQVTPSFFSGVQNDIPKFRRYYLAIVAGLAFITFPASAGLALTADLFIPVFLGEKWRAAILPLQILSAYAGFRSIDTVTPQVLIFGGHSSKSMWFNIRAACVLPLLFYFASRWGTAGVAGTWVVAYPVIVFPIYITVFKILELSPKQYFANLWPAASGTLVMILAVFAVRWSLRATLSPGRLLPVVVVTGAMAYAATMLLAHRSRVLGIRDLLRSVRS